MRTAVRGMALQERREFFDQLFRQLVHAIIVIAVARERLLVGKAHGNAAFVANGFDLAVADRAQRIRRHRKTGDAKGHEPFHLAVVQRQLRRFIGIAIMHIMDQIHRIHVKTGQPLQHSAVAAAHYVIIQIFAFRQGQLRRYLERRFLVFAAVNGHQKRLSQIGPRAKELHLLPQAHSRHAAGNAVIIAVNGAHQIVAFVLNGAGIDGHFSAEAFEAFRQSRRPEHRQIGFRRRSQIVKSMQNTERRLGHQRAAVYAHAAYRFRHPERVAGKELVIIRRAQLPRQPQLNYQLINDFLRAALVQKTCRQIALKINIQKGRNAANGHSRPVLILNSC